MCIAFFNVSNKMNTETVRNLLIRDKTFLRELYEGPSKVYNNRILNFATDSKLDTLLKLLHFLANGEIPMKKNNFEVVQSHKKLAYIKRHVEKKSAVLKMLKAERQVKVKFLKQLSNIFAPLLYCLFNEV